MIPLNAYMCGGVELTGWQAYAVAWLCVPLAAFLLGLTAWYVTRAFWQIRKWWRGMR